MIFILTYKRHILSISEEIKALLSIKARIGIPGEETKLSRINDLIDEVIAVHAAGHVVGGNGKATFAGHLSTGDIGAANGIDILDNIGDGSFDDPLGSFVLIHIVDHGPAVAGTIPENIHEFTGAIGLAQEWSFVPGN